MYESATAANDAVAGGALKLADAQAHSSVDRFAATLPEKTATDKEMRAAVTKNCNSLYDALVEPRLNYSLLDERLKNLKSIKDLVTAKVGAGRAFEQKSFN